MDKFYRRDLPNKINAALDKACMEMFGFPFRDGTGAKSRGTVEEMKLESTRAEQQLEQEKLESTKAERKREEAQLERLQNEVLDTQGVIFDKQMELQDQERKKKRTPKNWMSKSRIRTRTIPF